MSKCGEILKFPIANGTAKMSGRYHGIHKSTPIRDQPDRGERPQSQPVDEMTDDAEARNDFWSIGGDFIYRHHVEPRVQLYVAKEETFPIPLKYTDVTRAICTKLDVLQGRIDDCCNVGVDRSLSDSWTGFTKFT